MDQDLLERSVTEATTEVFSTMLGIDIRCMGAASPPRRSEFGIISLVGITGKWAGSGVVCCSPALASVLCSRMLGGEEEPGAPAINEEVLDVVAEITNMMIGNIKNGLECVTGPLAISVPTVIHGRNFEFRNSSGLRAAALAFSVEDKIFEVRISLAPASERSGVRSRIPILGLAQA